MSEFEAGFDPFSPRELIFLLPDKCAGCKFAAFIVALEQIHPDMQKPMETVKDIGERCTGYEGSDPESEMYSQAFDRSGCPYAVLISEEKDGQEYRVE